MKEQERGRERVRERERVEEIIRQLKERERDHVNSAERVYVRQRWLMKEIMQEKESVCKKVSLWT